MRNRAPGFVIASIALAVAVLGPRSAIGQEKPAESPRKVLVELYTSQGCNSCPPASDLLDKLAGLGHGPDRVVILNFHVDYFNTPWVDPFSDPAYSRRQQAYNSVLRRNDLYFTPLMMVDGRVPLLGSDRPRALAALKAAREEPAGVGLGLALDGPATRKTLSVKLAAKGPSVVGRELLVGVAVTEDPVSTVIPSGENAGRTLVEHQVVRRFDHRFVTLDRSETRTLAVPVELAAGWDASRFRVAVFVQDRANGKVYQADAVPWSPSPAPAGKKMTARRKPKPPATVPDLAGFNFSTPMIDSSGGDDATCPACGSAFTPPETGPIVLHRGHLITLPPPPTC